MSSELITLFMFATMMMLLFTGQRVFGVVGFVGALAALRAEGLQNVSSVIAEGPAGDAIVEIANEEGADVIIMATHGRGGLGRVLLGSVADHVVRNAHRQAVLLVRPPAEE